MDRKYITAAEFARKNGCSYGYVCSLLSQGRIPGAQRVVDRWMVPADAVMPPRRETKVTTAEGYLRPSMAAEKWGVSVVRVRQFCAQGRIPGAVKRMGQWLIPEGANYPATIQRGTKHGE